MSISRELKPSKKNFVSEFIEGYIDGHQDRIESMDAEEANRKLLKLEGYAEGFYELIYGEQT